MSLTWERLDWDSDFFGVGIGAVDLTGATTDDLDRIDSEARAAGIACLYASHLHDDAADLSVLVQEHGYRFVEAAVQSSLPNKAAYMPTPPGVTLRRGGPDDVEAIAHLAALLADWSRFAVDPRFGREEARRLQLASIARAAADPTGERSLHIAEDANGPVAFITRFTHPERGIDAIGTTAHGGRSPQALVQQTREWATDLGCDHILGGPISARNVVATRFVTNMGYRVIWTRYHYHRWLAP